MDKTYDMVFLAENEWGNQIMREVAAQWFKDHPDCQFVQIYEHDGWWLAFHCPPTGSSQSGDRFTNTPDGGWRSTVPRQAQAKAATDALSLAVIGTANSGAAMRPDRPRPTAFSGVEHRRQIRPGAEGLTIESLAQYRGLPTVELHWGEGRFFDVPIAA